MKVLVVKPGKKPEVCEIQNELEDFQDVVGGEIQEIEPYEDPIAIILNEEGKILDLPMNRNLKLPWLKGAYTDVLYGTFLIVGTSGDDYISLSQELLDKYANYFEHVDYTTDGRVEYTIWQVDLDKDTQCIAFMDKNFLDKYELKIQRGNYRRVFSGWASDNLDVHRLSEQIYATFNYSHPHYYRGRSMSVSDVIEICNGKETKYFFCDSIGFAKLDNFD